MHPPSHQLVHHVLNNPFSREEHTSERRDGGRILLLLWSFEDILISKTSCSDNSGFASFKVIIFLESEQSIYTNKQRLHS